MLVEILLELGFRAWNQAIRERMLVGWLVNSLVILPTVDEQIAVFAYRVFGD
jgi:hypothetical protein